MNNIFRILSAFLLLAHSAGAQEISKEALQRDLRAIINEASRGFPTNTGLTSEDPYAGNEYGTDLSFFGIHKYASLRYQKAQDYKYSKPQNEQFYFSQSFYDTSEAGKFMAANAEAVLDAQAQAQGLKKVTVKQEKQYRNMFKVIEFRQLGKPLFVFTRYLESHATGVTVHSPYRPQDVKVANLLGCMVYTYENNSFMYVVPVYGPVLGDKEKVAGDAYTKSGQVERRYQYEWMAGSSVKQVEQKWQKQFRVIVMNAYTVE